MIVWRDLTRKGWHKAERNRAAPYRDASGKPALLGEIVLSNVTFKLSEAARQRCLRQLADASSRHGWEVHAYAVGTEVQTVPAGERIAITYDKHGCGRFVRKDTGAAIAHCDYVWFAPDGHSYAIGAVS